MRQLTDVEIDRIRMLTENSVELTLIEPTGTGLEKSIMDATGSVRSYLKLKKVHDFELQKQGQESKIQVQSFLIEKDSFIPSVASLYRPNTKKGDPRIWFKGLGGYSKANDILGIFEFQNSLYVLNITQLDLEKILNSALINPLKDVVGEIRQFKNAIADELLFKIRRIASRGYVPALLNADTAIGRTLEFLLDVKMNSKKTPDYKGIELKSFRDKRGNRKNLFARVPDWDISKLKSSDEILHNFGYVKKDILRLYCTLSAIVRNSQGLMLRVDNNLRYLIENSDKPEMNDYAAFRLDSLHEAMNLKHKETFWVAADSKFEDGKEYFQFKKVEHTQKPIISQFDILLEQGIITLDHLIKVNEKGSVAEKGPIFKLKPKALSLLFPPSKIYSLI